MALPLGKLGDLVLKTLSKPLAKAIKRRAASHPKFRASIANWAQVRAHRGSARRAPRVGATHRLRAQPPRVLSVVPHIGCAHCYPKFCAFIANWRRWVRAGTPRSPRTPPIVVPNTCFCFPPSLLTPLLPPSPLSPILPLPLFPPLPRLSTPLRASPPPFPPSTPPPPSPSPGLPPVHGAAAEAAVRAEGGRRPYPLTTTPLPPSPLQPPPPLPPPQGYHRFTVRLQRRLYGRGRLGLPTHHRCAPPLSSPWQGYHRFTVRLQRRLYGQAPAGHIKRLNEEKAVNTASEVVGELIVFAVAGGVVFIEAARSARSNARKEAKLKQEREALHERDRQLEEEATRLRERVEQLEEALAADVWLPRAAAGDGVVRINDMEGGDGVVEGGGGGEEEGGMDGKARVGTIS
ncbi:unnamed protein product [Closterium sp. Yama58-4]|nr:unnamed protein product [Closterium sp. Yama58-4]